MSLQMGTKKGIALAQFGQVLEYPSKINAQSRQRLCDSIVLSYPKAAKEIDQFCSYCSCVELSKLEEVFTRTFDLAAICSPYVTGYIFGDENFDRGTLMAVLGEKYTEYGFNSGGELPDHLAILLRFSGWLDEEALDELIKFCLLQPVSEMVDRLKDSDNPYYFLLSALLVVLKCDLSGDSKHD